MTLPSKIQQSYSDTKEKFFSTICFQQLILPEELRFHRRVSVNFPDLNIYVNINELYNHIKGTSDGWTAIISNNVDNTNLYEMTKGTPGELLKWLVLIRYGTCTWKYNRIRFVTSYRGNTEFTKHGHVKSCM